MTRITPLHIFFSALSRLAASAGCGGSGEGAPMATGWVAAFNERGFANVSVGGQGC